MKIEPFFVFDTNALISAHLIEGSISDKAYKLALKLGFIAISEELMLEFVDVACRKKFDRYFGSELARLSLADKIEANAVLFTCDEKIRASQDPDDNMILELGLSSKAACIVSGDPHLLTLHPFRGIPILSPADFLKLF
jgi:uncharacterized protein